MPENVIRAIMARRNPRTGKNYTREEAEAIVAARENEATASQHAAESEDRKAFLARMHKRRNR